MTKNAKPNDKKMPKKMTNINIQRPSEFAGKILKTLVEWFHNAWNPCFSESFKWRS